MYENRSRKWQITINNPIENGYSHEIIKNKLSSINNLIYYCMSDEIGLKENTYHTHVYIYCSNVQRFSRIKNLFEIAHIENARGTSQENRDYIKKEGKYLGTEKEETNLKDTFEEFGDLPNEQQGKRKDINLALDLIKAGYSNIEIFEEIPSMLLHIDKLDKTRQELKSYEFATTWRNLEVHYIFGETGTGKTRSVMEKYGYSNVYRITDYKNPFDSYNSQDVIIFEEFRSSLNVSDMLKYLEGYPLELPCRYANKTACYTKVFIISNISLDEQFISTQKYERETYLAFLRRINLVEEFKKDKVIE